MCILYSFLTNAPPRCVAIVTADALFPLGTRPYVNTALSMVVNLYGRPVSIGKQAICYCDIVNGG